MLMSLNEASCAVIDAMIQEKIVTAIVLIAVAVSESVFLIPHFARIDVMPAKNAEPAANMSHISFHPQMRESCPAFRL